jgi:Zn-dependent protease with chaperone function
VSYNNLLYLLVVIFLLSARSVSEETVLPVWQAALFFVGKFCIFHFICRRFFAARRVADVKKYLKAEKHLTLLALSFLAIDIYLLDCLSYFSFVPFARDLPIIARFLGLLLFFGYLSDIWLVASSRSAAIFGRATRGRHFVFENVRSNLPIVLPWFSISLLLDILNVLPVPGIRSFMESGYGETSLLVVFFFFIALAYPPLLMKIWACRPMAQGAAREHMVSFCRRLNLHYHDIMIWPLFGGQMVTAGVVGFVARFRYILVTPGLLANLSDLEIDAVLAHETGHVKRYHMQLYLFVLLGFSVIINPLYTLFLYAAFRGDWLYHWADLSAMSAPALLELILPVGILVVLVLFLRFVFGFFMRNFERQADLYAFTTFGGGAAISAALEKVAWLSGDIRALPSWHHFGISQRVDFLAGCDANPALVARHHRKVYQALGLYCLLVVSAGLLSISLPRDLVEQGVTGRAISKLQEEAVKNPDNYQVYWALGDIHYRVKAYAQAIAAYEQSLLLVPENAEVLNNLAWLLLTCEDARFIDDDRGLLLASKAVRLKSSPHILDTLAHAYWLKGEKEMALEIEKRALATARPDQKKIYDDQLKKWQEMAGNTSGPGLEF